VIARLSAKPHRYPADEPSPTLTQNVVGDYAAVIPAEQGFRQNSVTSLHAFEYARSHYQRIVLLRQGRILFDVPVQAVSPAMVEAL